MHYIINAIIKGIKISYIDEGSFIEFLINLGIAVIDGNTAGGIHMLSST